MPENVEVIAGPGCPVCIVPAAEIDEAVQLAQKGIVVTCFGDVLRVPGSQMSLLEAKAAGADVRIVYAVSDAVEMAKHEPNKQFAFFAVGFETTAPSTAVEALGNPPKNLSFLVSHRLIPPAMELLLGVGDLQIDGFIAPGHVSAIIGLKPYELFPRVYRMPTVVAGFEPIDVLMSIYMIVKQQSDGTAKLENEYPRVVKPEGNPKALEMMNKAFTVTAGTGAESAGFQTQLCSFARTLADYDARIKHDVHVEQGKDIIAWLRMPPCNHRKNQAQRMPNVPESLHARETCWRMHGQQRRHLQSLGKKCGRPSLKLSRFLALGRRLVLQ